MGWGIALLLAVQAISLFLQPRVASADARSPLLSPFTNVLCDSVQCGKGSCKTSLNHTFGFYCECDPGWTKFHLGDNFQFLPCVVPNCTFNYSCNNNAGSAPPPIPAPPSNYSIFDPCLWSSCGDGATCVTTSTFGHRCDCKTGYANLLNVTYFPCLQQCALGLDCAKLGIGLSGGSPSPSPLNLPGNGNSASRATIASGWNLISIATLTISLAMLHGD